MSQLDNQFDLSVRSETRLPTWLKPFCVLIVVVQATKFPALSAYVSDMSRANPAVGAGLDAATLTATFDTGVAIVLLISALVSCLALLAFARMLLKLQTRSTSGDAAAALRRLQTDSRLLAFGAALVLPDIWTSSGVLYPYAHVSFWATHLVCVAVVLVVTRASVTSRQAIITLGASLLGILL